MKTKTNILLRKSSVVKKSNNDLAFTKRERELIKWFLKFYVVGTLTVACWQVPGEIILKNYKNYQNLVKTTEQFHPINTAQATTTPQKQSKNEVKTQETNLTPEQQIRQIAEEHNFQWIDYLMRLAKCENDTFDPLRRGDIDPRDRGVFQINSYWHPEVSDECAFDVRCSTEWTMWRIESGYQHEWMCDKLI